MSLNEIPGRPSRREEPPSFGGADDSGQPGSRGWLTRQKSSVLNGMGSPRVHGKILFGMLSVLVVFVMFLAYQKYYPSKSAKQERAPALPPPVSAISRSSAAPSAPSADGSLGADYIAIMQADQDMVTLQEYLVALEKRVAEWQAYAASASKNGDRAAYDLAAAEYGKVAETYDQGLAQYARLVEERKALAAKIDAAEKAPAKPVKAR